MKYFEMKYFFSIYGLKFIKWNVNIVEIIKYFILKNCSILKYNVHVDIKKLMNSIFFKNKIHDERSQNERIFFNLWIEIY